jgi:hypothetical protein
VSTPVYGAHEANFYYVEETNYGETPATPNMIGLGSVENVEPALNPSNIKVRGLGSRDLQFIEKGLRQVNLKVDYYPPNTLFLDYITTLDSLSIEVFYEKSSGIIDLLHKGCRMNTLTVECSVEGLLKASAELIGQNVAVGTTKIGGSYGGPSGVVPFYESYVKKATTTLERVTDFRFVIANNLKQIPVIRSTNGYLLKYLSERHRQLSGELTFEFETKGEFDDIINDTDFSLEFGLGGTHKATFTNCKWESISSPTRIEDLVALKAPFVGKGLTIV